MGQVLFTVPLTRPCRFLFSSTSCPKLSNLIISASRSMSRAVTVLVKRMSYGSFAVNLPLSPILPLAMPTLSVSTFRV